MRIPVGRGRWCGPGARLKRVPLGLHQPDAGVNGSSLLRGPWSIRSGTVGQARSGAPWPIRSGTVGKSPLRGTVADSQPLRVGKPAQGHRGRFAAVRSGKPAQGHRGRFAAVRVGKAGAGAQPGPNTALQPTRRLAAFLAAKRLEHARSGRAGWSVGRAAERHRWAACGRTFVQLPILIMVDSPSTTPKMTWSGRLQPSRAGIIAHSVRQYGRYLV